MQTVRRWLDQLELPQYADVFERNAVDLEIAKDLTDQDLQDLGIEPLGHRKKLLRAIAKLNGPHTPTASALAAQDRPALEQSFSVEAERRQLTVLFCDLVGSTALAQRLDPEALRELMHVYQRACGGVIDKYAGHVAQYLGDGLMVYFGWPRAHEDDAERAVRAALGMVEAVNQVPAPDPLQVRIGIATGPVVVGETGAGDASVPKAAVGQTPNLAARLQGLAAPGQVVIAPSTHRLLGNTFEYEDLGEHALKGIDETVRAHRITGVAHAESRFEATRSGRYTPFVGREQEIGLLLARWEQAREGEGQVMLLCGEPGIGKSRITQVLHERLEAVPHTRLRWQCSPYHTSSAFQPIISQLERAAGFERGDAAQTKLDKLEAALALSAEELPAVAPLIGALLSLPAERYPARMLSPQKQKELTVAALAAQVIRLAQSQPLLMIVEDAHWIDPSTLETLALMVERIRDAAILLVITCRPEFVPPWTGHGNVTLLNLNRLSRRYGLAMMGAVTAGKSLPEEVVDQILAKTEGIPLFVEELTKTVLEAGILRDAGDRYELSGPLPPLAIPSTLQDSLMARLDRLARVKEVAQIGACIGREFPYELLAAVSPLGSAELQAALEQLVRSELVFQRGGLPDAVYSFKHALVQDAAYESLLKRRRQQYHAQIARTTIAEFPELAKQQPEVVAHHLTEAGLHGEAIPYWQLAGERAVARMAHREAVAHFNKWLAVLDHLPDSSERARQELDLQTRLGPSLVAINGYAAAEVAHAYGRARELCQRVPDSPRLFSTLHGLWVFHLVRGDLRESKILGEQLLGLAEHEQDPEMLTSANDTVGESLLYLGEFTRPREHLTRSLGRYDPARSIAKRGHWQDLKVTALAYLSTIEWLFGHPDRALEQMRQAISWAHELSHPFSLAWALAWAARLHRYRREPQAVERHADQLLALALEHGFPFWLSVGRTLLGWAKSEQGQPKEGIALIRDGLASLQAIGAEAPRVVGLVSLADAHLKAGEADAGLTVLAEAEAAARTMELGWIEAQIDDLKGELLLTYAKGSPDSEALEQQAEASFHRSIGTARRRQDKAFELRAATRLARLWQKQGKTREAGELLAPLYGWFTEGFDTADLKEAKALLTELS